VQFADGLVVVRSRTSQALEIYPGGVAEIRSTRAANSHGSTNR